MSWLWLGLLAATGGALWLRRRLLLRRDAMLQESLDHFGGESGPKQPPAKQPWSRPGFGPPPRPQVLDLGAGPLPPPAGEMEDPAVAGPIPDDEDIPALIPIDVSPKPDEKPPPPPPPGATVLDAEPPPAESAGPAEPTESAARPAESAARPAESAEPTESAGESDEPEISVPDATDDDLIETTLRGPQVVDLTPELADEVRSLMQSKKEVAAVRLVCDSMGVGILDAQRTVRALVGR